MSPDLAITIMLGGEVAVIGVVGSILVWHADRLSKDPKSLEELKRVRVEDSRDGITKPQGHKVLSSDAAGSG